MEASGLLAQPAATLNGAVDARDIYVTEAVWAIEDAETSEARAKASEPFKEVARRETLRRRLAKEVKEESVASRSFNEI